jgi:rhodanese-related sulfurtransferase
MKLNKTTLFFSLLFISSSARAIPPPDTILSVWQSVLQLLGVISVFLVGFYYSLKQYLSYWKKPLLIILVLTILLGSGTFILMYKAPDPITETKSPQEILENTQNNSVKPISLIQGELLSIEAVIRREPSEYVRTWKLDTYKKMQANLIAVRKQKQLAAVSYQNIPSFKPAVLQQHLKQSPEQLFLLDVRGAFERKNFYLPYQETVHYGDLINDTLPRSLINKLPKNKLIVVLCHSGLRGYFAANLLRQQGYTNVAFLQGGLAAWHKEMLPINGDEDFSANLAVYPLFSERKAHQADLLKVEIDPDNKFVKDIKGLIHLPFEIASSKEIERIIQRSKSKPVLIVCRTYSGCFHLLNFGYMIEQAGGKVAGIFDKSGQYVIVPMQD